MPGDDQPIATVITKRFTIDDPYDHVAGASMRGSQHPRSKKGHHDITDKVITWLEFLHPEYKRSYFKWFEAGAHYTGELLEEHNIEHFLVRKTSAESWDAYRERKRLSDYSTHFATAVDSLAGMLFQVESNAKRFTGTNAEPGLGDQAEKDTSMHRLWRNIDGLGTNWITFFKELAIELIYAHTAWVTVDTLSGGEGVARVWPAISVTNWIWKDGVLAEVMVEEIQDERETIEDEPQFTQRWVVYKLEGWERWRKEEGDNREPKPVLVDSGAYSFKDEMGRSVLPIFPVNLPMKRHVGWMMARKANVIFNKESERDHLLRAANFPFLLLVMADKQFRQTLNRIRQGIRAIQVDPAHGHNHSFIAPGSESAQIATEVLIRKVEEFYVTFFQSYGDSARERTATEARQDVSAGVGAFLQLLKTAVDEAENRTMQLLAQIEFPSDERRWFVNHVERSEDFLPLNVAAEIEKIKERYFGADKIVPIGKTGRLAAATRIAEWDGLEVDEMEIDSALDLHQFHSLLDSFRELSIPAMAKAELSVRFLAGLGIIDPDATIEMADGTKKPLTEIVKEAALELAEKNEEMASNLASMLPVTGGGGSSHEEEEEEEEEEDDDEE